MEPSARRLSGIAGRKSSSPGMEKIAETCGIKAAADELDIRPGEFEHGTEVAFPEGRAADKFVLCNEVAKVAGADGSEPAGVIINLCKMKTHQLERITGAVKNTFGCVCGVNKAASHAKFESPEHFARMLADLNRLVRPALHIMDGVIAMEGNGSITSCDIHPHKTGLIENGAARLGLENITALCQDATAFREEWEQRMDAVFCDVPCSGLGIIRKKPDIRYKNLKELEQLPPLQLAILTNQSRYVRPGGVLMYSTCTVLKRENEAVVEAFLKEHPDFYTEPLELPGEFDKNETGMLTLIPGQFDTDGFFICRLRRKA